MVRGTLKERNNYFTEKCVEKYKEKFFVHTFLSLILHAFEFSCIAVVFINVSINMYFISIQIKVAEYEIDCEMQF